MEVERGRKHEGGLCARQLDGPEPGPAAVGDETGGS